MPDKSHLVKACCVRSSKPDEVTELGNECGRLEKVSEKKVIGKNGCRIIRYIRAVKRKK